MPARRSYGSVGCGRTAWRWSVHDAHDWKTVRTSRITMRSKSVLEEKMHSTGGDLLMSTKGHPEFAGKGLSIVWRG